MRTSLFFPRSAPPFLLCLILLALVSSACRLPPPKSSAVGTRVGVAGPHRVILISLDGASTQELHRLYERGELTAGGFDRFFRDGAVADAMIPVNPTLTSVNHIALATGVPADQTGIVGNVFHPHGAEWGKTVSGFAYDIAAETLWEAARRQGRRVGSMTWPGADNTGPRRRADWGLIYVNDPDRASDLLTVPAGSWKGAEGPELPASFSPRLTATVQSKPANGAPPDVYELVALDSSDDGKTDYDTLTVRSAGDSATVSLKRGESCRIACSIAPPEGAVVRKTTCPARLLELDADLGHVSLYLEGIYPLRAYPPSFQEQVTVSGLEWPGPPDDRRLEDGWKGLPGIDLETWSLQSERFAHFFMQGILLAAARNDWDLLLGYLPVIDEAGHQLSLLDPRQPRYSDDRKAALAATRLRTWQAVDREIARLLKAIDLTRTTVVLVSDHGMTPIHTALDANILLQREGLLTADDLGKIVPGKSAAIAVSGGGICHVYLAPGQEARVPELKRLFSAWRFGKEGARLERVVTRAEAADVQLDSPNSGDLILFAPEGYGFSGSGLQGGHDSYPAPVYGMHGFLNSNADIQSIYLALGAGVTPGDRSVLRSIDVAGRVSAWMGMRPPGSR